MVLEEPGRDDCGGGAGVEKSSGNCPEGKEELDRKCEGFVRVGVAFTYFNVGLDVCFRAISSGLFQRRL